MDHIVQRNTIRSLGNMLPICCSENCTLINYYLLSFQSTVHLKYVGHRMPIIWDTRNIRNSVTQSCRITLDISGVQLFLKKIEVVAFLDVGDLTFRPSGRQSQALFVIIVSSHVFVTYMNIIFNSQYKYVVIQDSLCLGIIDIFPWLYISWQVQPFRCLWGKSSYHSESF